MHRNSRLIFEAYAKTYFRNGLKVLEIAPDSWPSTYCQIINNRTIQWDTLEIATPHNQTCLPKEQYTYLSKNKYEFPVDSASYDIVFSGNVIEHVQKVWVWMKELARICRRGGYVITVNPLSWPYHECPIDCWRIYPEGMRAVYEDAGLTVKLSTCECMELKMAKSGDKRSIEGLKIQDLNLDNMCHIGVRRLYPGVANPTNEFKTMIKKMLGWPISAAFDTITIGVRP